MKNILKIRFSFFTYLYLIIILLSGLYRNLLVISFILIIHELGHILFFYLFNIKINEIIIYPFGIYGSINKDINTSINKDLLIYFGGLLFQFILYLIAIYIGFNNKMFYIYNKSIFIFNLLPIFPLDGFYILNCFFNKLFSFKFSYKISCIISLIFSLYFILINKNIIIFLLLFIKSFKEIFLINKYFNKYLLERFLNTYHFFNIKYLKNINKMKRDTYHFFIINKNVYKEDFILLKRFDNK